MANSMAAHIPRMTIIPLVPKIFMMEVMTAIAIIILTIAAEFMRFMLFNDFINTI